MRDGFDREYDRVLGTGADTDEIRHEAGLRPRKMEMFVGQDTVVKNLSVYVEAALRRGKPLDHVLLAGPPGLGKTSLALILAQELGTPIRTSSGPAIIRSGELSALLSDLQPGGLLFIDEIHRLSSVVEEVLYPAMEDFVLDVTVGQGPGAHSARVELPPFTLIGATTRAGLLTAPLRDRFGIVERLAFYSRQDLQQIILRAAARLAIEIVPQAADEVASRSRGTPRIALRLLRRLRDFADVETAGIVTMDLARRALSQLGVDDLGLDDLDRRLLQVIVENHGGGPVGLNTLAASLGEEVDTLEEVSEPFLIQIGFLERTSRGRVATKMAHEHLASLGDPPGGVLGT